MPIMIVGMIAALFYYGHTNHGALTKETKDMIHAAQSAKLERQRAVCRAQLEESWSDTVGEGDIYDEDGNVDPVLERKAMEESIGYCIEAQDWNEQGEPIILTLGDHQ